MAAPSAPRRRTPLVAPGHEHAVDHAAAVEPASAAPAAPRGPLAGLAAGLATAVAATGLLYGLAAGPVYVLAQIATDGLDRPVFRTTLVVALVASVVLGIGIGVAVGVWYGRGGHLPSDRRSFTDLAPHRDRSSSSDR